MMPARKQEIDAALYRSVKEANIRQYEMICAFASTFGTGEEEISLKTRYQVERFCMSLCREQGEAK